jgi:hypothetical protein
MYSDVILHVSCMYSEGYMYPLCILMYLKMYLKCPVIFQENTCILIFCMYFTRIPIPMCVVALLGGRAKQLCRRSAPEQSEIFFRCANALGWCLDGVLRWVGVGDLPIVTSQNNSASSVPTVLQVKDVKGLGFQVPLISHLAFPYQFDQNGSLRDGRIRSDQKLARMHTSSVGLSCS